MRILFVRCATLALCRLLLALASLVEATDVGVCEQVGRSRVLSYLAVLGERLGLLATLVHLDDGACALGCNLLEVGSDALVRRVDHGAGENVRLEEVVVAVECLQNHVARRHLATCLNVVVHLVVEAALQLGAHAGEFLRIERYVLNASGVCADAHEVLHPCGAAEFSAAGARTADASCLLACSDLLHLDAHVEGVGKHLDELTEVDTLVGDVVEYRLVAVALILHVTNLHLQTEVLGYLSALNHGAVFAAFRLVVFVDVHGFSNAIYALYVVSRLEVGFLQLQLHQTSGERNRTDVVTRTCLNRHDVALVQVDVVDVVVVTLARVLELHLHEVSVLVVARHVVQPVVCVELHVLSSASVVVQSAIGVTRYLELHIFEIFHCDLCLFFTCYEYNCL